MDRINIGNTEETSLNEKKDNIISNTNNLNELTDEEKLKAKENGFILLGKTGVGKTSLLNLIYKDKIGKVGCSLQSETKNSNYYCIKEKTSSETIYFCIIDTPGLYDSEGREEDKKQKNEIIQLISKEKIKIKGILFISNFQNERFDASEQDTLLQYNVIFPLKDFWKRVILIFTHYYGDPDGDSKEDIREHSTKILSEIFILLMDKVKDVSDPISFLDMKRKYYNIHSIIKNNNQKESNENNRNEIIFEISNFIKLKPMFSKLEIFNFEKYEIDVNDDYLYDCNLILYLDSSDNIIHQEFELLQHYPKNESNINNMKIKLDIENCEIIDGKIVKKTTIKEGLKEIFKYKEGLFGSVITVGSIIGCIITSGLFGIGFIPSALLIGKSYVDYTENKKNEEKKVNDLLVEQNINNLINQELKRYLEKK